MESPWIRRWWKAPALLTAVSFGGAQEGGLGCRVRNEDDPCLRGGPASTKGARERSNRGPSLELDETLQFRLGRGFGRGDRPRGEAPGRCKLDL
jgi:hypothetical protein